jgi:hypothetical protein
MAQQLVAEERSIRAPRIRKVRKHRHAWFWFLCGAGVSLLAAELLLHPISGKYETPTEIEIRNFREGQASAHFLPNGLRLTGNPQIPGAPAVLIIGDSHVEAFQIPDDQTMGALVERKLRASGKQWNAWQYGWSGAEGADYIFAAPMFLEKFPTPYIFLTMNDGDFRTKLGEQARISDRNGTVIAEGLVPNAVRGREPSFGGHLARKMKESGLIYGAALRFQLDLEPQWQEHTASAQDAFPPNGASSAELMEMIVRGLKQQYGDKLRVVYMPPQPFSAQESLEPAESLLMAQCQAQGVQCRSIRDRMIHELTVNHQLCRGFSDTKPGKGHLNARGHELVADEIFDWLNSN